MTRARELNEDESLRDPVQARRKAMDYLARREYGRRELKTKLESTGFSKETASVAVDRLACEGLQCDRRFVENFIQSRIDQGKGPVRIRLELDQRQLEADLIDEVLADTETDWAALARQVRAKKFGAGLPSDFEDRARQMRFLQYRGFESDHIQAAIAPHGDN